MTRTFILALAPLTLLLAACADTAESPHATPSSAVTSSAATATPAITSTAAAATPGVRTTGIAGLDEIIAAATRGDVNTLRQKIRFTPIACIATPQGIGAPPLCRTAEADGTKIDALPSAECEGFFSRPDEITLTSLASGGTLYAIYRATPDTFPAGSYVAIFTRPPSALPPNSAFSLTTDDTSILGINYGCGQTPEDFVTNGKLTDAILPPALHAP